MVGAPPCFTAVVAACKRMSNSCWVITWEPTRAITGETLLVVPLLPQAERAHNTPAKTATHLMLASLLIHSYVDCSGHLVRLLINNAQTRQKIESNTNTTNTSNE